MLDGVTLDQLRMLVAIADAGSFTAAAKRIARAQSAVSHGIAALETQLQLSLFDRAHKTPRLTEAGLAVLADARLAIARIDQLKARARGLSEGLESELSLALTALAPMAPVVDLLDQFRTTFPTVAVEVFVEEIGGSALLVQERVCQIGVAGAPGLRLPAATDLVAVPIGEVAIVAVARPDHPLVAIGRTLTREDLNEHCQLIPTSRARASYPNTLARSVWRVGDLAARRQMILRGIGWGTVPHHLVADDLAAGRLVALSLESRPLEIASATLFAIHRPDAPPGPAGRWLVEQLGVVFRGEGG
jgi:DNA-binding transcriptional LysR family regulator